MHSKQEIQGHLCAEVGIETSPKAESMGVAGLK